MRTRLGYVLLSFLLSAAALGQATTSTLTGTVTTEGSPLPGVTVSATSPALLGGRTTVTGASGDYLLAGLPPGRYNVTFELQGMQTLNRRADLKLAEPARLDADLKVTAVAESITVTATSPSVLETTQVSTNIAADTVEQLAMGRRIQDRIQIAPGVQSSGPNGQTIINGANSFDNLYLVNGVVVNENVRGQPQAAVIEDAIQETTLLTGGVSAEFGRFTGGVVSTITRSGGNDFSGSIRDNLTNDKWVSKTAFHDPVTGVGEVNHTDKVSQVWEATLGGRVIYDRLWFFVAGRKENSSLTDQTVGTNIPYSQTRDQKRYEAKLTGNVTSRHTLIASYLRVDDQQANTRFGNIVDLASLRSVENPIRLWSGHYNGVITNELLIEGLYSQKDFAIVGGGSSFRDPIYGTMMRDIATGRRGWSPTFCGVCPPKERNNQDWALKGTYFLSTKALGSHTIVGGYDEFHELRNENNYQSGSDFRFFGDFVYVGDQVFIRADPTLVNGVSRSRIQWDPLLALSQTSDFGTKSLFVNDKWAFSPRWSFNVGLRYDKNEGENQARAKTVSDSRISPRLGAIFDLRGNGHHRLSLSYGRYAAKIDQGPADSTSPAGRYATYLFQYRGPSINPVGTPNNQLLTTDRVLEMVFAWFNANGGASATNPLIFSASVPGLNVRIDEPLKSPIMDEISLGYGTQIGGNGYVRADLIHRSWSDFYVLRRDLSTGKTADGRLDVGLIENGDNDDFERTYNGLQIQGNYKVFDLITLGGNYTWAKLRGNVEGEEFNNATVPVGLIQAGGNEAWESPTYPEYTRFARNRPVGYLSGDVRHRANVWIQYRTQIPFGELALSLLERFHTGQAYSAAERIAPIGITNPGYARPPAMVQYYFSERGAYRLDDISSTDVNATYTLPISKLNLFVKTDVLNLFNQQGLEFAENPNSTAGPVIEKRVTILQNFNPLTTAPVEGVHYRLNPNFGKATNKDAYQLPRAYRFAVGLRF